MEMPSNARLIRLANTTPRAETSVTTAALLYISYPQQHRDISQTPTVCLFVTIPRHLVSASLCPDSQHRTHRVPL